MKKVLRGILFGFVSLLLVSLVLAQIEPGIPQAGQGAGDFFNNLYGAVTNVFNSLGLDQFSTTLLLLGILLWMILYSVLREVDLFGNSGLTTGIMSLILTILGFIYLRRNPVFINFLAGNIAGLAGAILALLPFIIAFYFTIKVSKSDLMARGVWLVFMIYYFINFIFIASYSGVGLFNFQFVRNDAGNFTGGGAWYFWAGIISTIAFAIIGFLRDKFFDVELESKKERALRNVELRKAGRDVETAEAKSRLG